MTTYRTTKRGHRIQIGAPADSDGDGFSGPYVGIVDPMAGAGFPISRPHHTRWGPSDCRYLADLTPIVVDDPDDEVMS